MKVIIAGSREHDNPRSKKVIMSWLDDNLSPSDITEVVSGECRGPDTFGEEWANNNDIPIVRFPASWVKYGRKAGPLRNKEMAEYADALVAFPVPLSKGTRDMITKAKRYQLDVTVVRLDELGIVLDEKQRRIGDF